MKQDEKNPCMGVVRDGEIIYVSYMHTRKELNEQFPNDIVIIKECKKGQMYIDGKVVDKQCEIKPEPFDLACSAFTEMACSNIDLIIDSFNSDQEVAIPAREEIHSLLIEFKKVYIK